MAIQGLTMLATYLGFFWLVVVTVRSRKEQRALFLVVCQALTQSRGGWTGTAGAMVFMAVVLLLKKGFVHKRLVGTLLGKRGVRPALL